MGKDVADKAIIFIAIVLLVLVLKTLKSFLLPFTIAIFFTMLLIPIIQLGRKKQLVAGISIFAVILGAVVFIYIFTMMVSSEVSEINRHLPEYEQNLVKSITYVNQLVPGEGLKLEQIIDTSQVIKYVKMTISVFKDMFGITSLAILFTIFLVPSYKLFIKRLGSRLTGKKKKKLNKAILETEKSIKNYLFVKTIMSAATAIVSASILYIFNSDFIVILAVLIFILNYIPNIGSMFATGIAITSYSISGGEGLSLLVLAILLIATQILFGNIFEPKIAGEKMKLSPVVILLSLFIWYWIWGLWGMFLAVPLTAIIKIILQHSESTKNVADLLS